MSINLHLPPRSEILKPTITVFGVGGAGGNAVNNMIASDLQGVNFVVANTDAQALERSSCQRRIQLGANLTRGLGAGAAPEIGRDAAEEAIDEIGEYIEGSNMVFITAGMGGGTGTGAAPVIARMAREQGVLTVGVVTKPFKFEGTHRMRLAERGLEELQRYVDTLIVIPNQNLFRIANERTTFADAFKMADEVLHSGVRGVTDLMVMPGLINLDFADIRAVMREMGKAMMGTGEAAGENRAIEAAEAAISNPLLDDVSMKGAKGVLINITGGNDMTLFEVDEAANRIREEVDPEANIIFGSTFSDAIDGKIRVSVVATGIDAEILREAEEAQKAAAARAIQQRREAVKQQQPAPALAANRFGTPVQSAPAVQQTQVRSTVAVASAPAAQETTESFNFTHAQAAAEPRLNLQQQEMAEIDQRSGAEANFIPPRAAQPAQRTYQGARPAEEEKTGKFSFFQRIAGMGKNEGDDDDNNGGGSRRRVEVSETKKPDAAGSSAKKEDQYLDIPAFLRRQAN